MYGIIIAGATNTVGGLLPSDGGTFSYPPERRAIHMEFEDVVLLLTLLGGTVYGTFQICFILFKKNEKK